MATQRLCSIEGCCKKHYGSGWCQMHYARQRKHGDPLISGNTARGEPQRFFREVVLAYDGDDCLFWPFTRHSWGYGQLHVDGKMQYVHTLICEQEHGARPTPDHEAAHSCGKGHLACVTRGHLGWKTKKQNQADRLVHGTHNRGERHWAAKLTPDVVRDIMALQGTMTQKDIAQKYGIRSQQVSKIHRRERWGGLD